MSESVSTSNDNDAAIASKVSEPNQSISKDAVIVFAITCITCALGSLTQTVMNSMLLGVQESFGTTESVSQWLTTIYMLVIGITVPIVTHLSRKYSVKTLMLCSLILVLAGSAIDFFAPNFWVLLFGRIPQAVATGITLPLLSTIAMTRFPKNKTGTAMGISGIAMGFAPNIGPLIGGALVQSWGWRSFFIILGAISVILLLSTIFGVKSEKAPEHNAHLDYISFVQSTLGFGCLLLGFTNASTLGIADIQVIVEIVLGVGFLIAFVARQLHLENPLISMKIFKTSDYTVSFIAQNLLFGSFMGITLIVPLFVQNVCGLSALDAGIVFVPATIAAAFVNPLAGILSDKLGARPVILTGTLIMFAGSLWMVFVSSDTPLWLLTIMQTVRGIGVSSLVGPLISWGMAKLPFDVMMDGSAFFTTVRQACASFGTALMMLAIVLFASSSFIALGYQIAFGLSALFAAILLVIAIAKIR